MTHSLLSENAALQLAGAYPPGRTFRLDGQVNKTYATGAKSPGISYRLEKCSLERTPHRPDYYKELAPHEVEF